MMGPDAHARPTHGRPCCCVRHVGRCNDADSTRPCWLWSGPQAGQRSWTEPDPATQCAVPISAPRLAPLGGAQAGSGELGPSSTHSEAAGLVRSGVAVDSGGRAGDALRVLSGRRGECGLQELSTKPNFKRHRRPWSPARPAGPPGLSGLALGTRGGTRYVSVRTCVARTCVRAQPAGPTHTTSKCERPTLTLFLLLRSPSPHVHQPPRSRSRHETPPMKAPRPSHNRCRCQLATPPASRPCVRSNPPSAKPPHAASRLDRGGTHAT
jgi:hypothetical protein